MNINEYYKEVALEKLASTGRLGSAVYRLADNPKKAMKRGAAGLGAIGAVAGAHSMGKEVDEQNKYIVPKKRIGSMGTALSMGLGAAAGATGGAIQGTVLGGAASLGAKGLRALNKRFRPGSHARRMKQLEEHRARKAARKKA